MKKIIVLLIPVILAGCLSHSNVFVKDTPISQDQSPNNIITNYPDQDERQEMLSKKNEPMDATTDLVISDNNEILKEQITYKKQELEKKQIVTKTNSDLVKKTIPTQSKEKSINREENSTETVDKKYMETSAIEQKNNDFPEQFPAPDKEKKQNKVVKKKQQKKDKILNKKETLKSIPVNLKTFNQEYFPLITQNQNQINYQNLDLDNIKIVEQEASVINAEENKELNISLKQPNWILKSSSPVALPLLSRENLKNSTSFRFQLSSPQDYQLLFIRYSEMENTIYRKPFQIVVKARRIFIMKQDEEFPDSEAKIITFHEDSGSEADQTQEKAAQPEVEQEDFRLDLANRLFDQGKYKEAKNRFESVIKDGYSDPELFYKLGVIEKADGNLEQAKTHFENNMNDQENIYYIKALLEYINLLKEQNKNQQALDAIYNRGFSLELAEEDAEELSLLLADVYYNMADYFEASREYQRFVQQFPHSSAIDKALFYLAYAMESYLNNPDYKESARLYQRILNEYPESNYFYLSKNRLLYLKRHFLNIY
ncbi:MAG: tetratricopeptide repeat protein [Spirochaetes bacterium]|nr:tetratricopeptide repeat protein [Spirochaetota bacterium]